MAKLVFSQVMKSGSGEGSRGGKIIGHTKSGKPVYAGRGARHSSYKNFTPDDHDEAGDMHLVEASKHEDASREAYRNKNRAKERLHDSKMDRHIRYANQHMERGDVEGGK